MRIVFMGTPDFAVPALAEIVGQGHEVAAVYTQPPRAAGRGMALRQSPVHRFAETAHLPVMTPANFKAAEDVKAFADHEADVAIVAAYGLILPRVILDAPAHGCLNLHASLLPRWRGAAPINRAIMAGDAETGIMVMRMEEGLDTGPVCMAERVAIDGDMTAGELHDVLAARGGDLVIRALAALSRGGLDCVPQAQEGVTYAKKIANEETRIDFSRPARQVHDQVRGLSPFPGAWFEAEIGGRRERIKVLRAQMAEGAGAPGTVLDDALTVACGEGAVRLLRLQRAGKKVMDVDEFARGVALEAGTRLN